MNLTLKTMIDNMPDKTGKSLEEWLGILKESAFEKHGEAVQFLKTEYGMTHGYANTIVHLSKDNPGVSTDLVAVQYKEKASLKPIYSALIKAAETFGSDVDIAPKKAYVSLRRKKQFALIEPSTKTRIDLGLNINGKTAEGNLEAAGSWNTMCSHRVRLSSVEDVTSEVISWIKEAYDCAG